VIGSIPLDTLEPPESPDPPDANPEFKPRHPLKNIAPAMSGITMRQRFIFPRAF
jgi:hypothetical protein